MERTELPNRRQNEYTTIRFRGVTYHVCFGLHKNGRIGEVFASSAKLGTDLVNTANDACIMISYLLQVGADKEDFAELLKMFQRDSNGEYTSIVAVLASLVESLMEEETSTNLVDHFIPERNETSEDEKDKVMLEHMAKKIQAKSAGYTGDACVMCHNVTMRRNGTCLVCDTCGSTTGCS